MRFVLSLENPAAGELDTPEAARGPAHAPAARAALVTSTAARGPRSAKGE